MRQGDRERYCCYERKSRLSYCTKDATSEEEQDSDAEEEAIQGEIEQFEACFFFFYHELPPVRRHHTVS